MAHSLQQRTWAPHTPWSGSGAEGTARGEHGPPRSFHGGASPTRSRSRENVALEVFAFTSTLCLRPIPARVSLDHSIDTVPWVKKVKSRPRSQASNKVSSDVCMRLSTSTPPRSCLTHVEPPSGSGGWGVEVGSTKESESEIGM